MSEDSNPAFDVFTGISERLFGPAAPDSAVGKMKAEQTPEPALVDPNAPMQAEQTAAANTAQSIPGVTETVGKPPDSIARTQEQQRTTPTVMPILQQQTNFTSGKQADPKLVTANENAELEVAKARQAEAVIAAETAKNQAIELQNGQAALLKQQQEAAAEQARIEQNKAERMAKFDSAMEERKAFKMNPNRYWDQMPGGSKIATVIGMALGAFGSSLSKSPNYAQQLVDNAINNDIKAQQMEYQKLGDNVDEAKNGYAFFRQKGLDAQSAATAQRISLLESTQAKIAAIAAQSKSPEIKANAETFSKQIQQKITDDRVKQDLNAKGQAVTQTVRGMPQGPSMTDQLKLRELEVSVPQKDGTTQIRLAKSADDAKKIGDAQVIAKSMKSTISRLRSLVAKDSQSLSPVAIAEATQLAKDLNIQYAVLRHLGAISKEDAVFAEAQTGDPTSWLQRDSTTMKLLDNFHDSINNELMATYEGKGLIETNTIGRDKEEKK